MKIGEYDLGQPIEFGFTSENQFYYPGNATIPSSNQIGVVQWQLNRYDPSNISEYIRDYPIPLSVAQSGNAEARAAMLYKEESSAYDTHQQYISPGTSAGYGTLNATTQNPIGNYTAHNDNNATIGAYSDYALWKANQLATTGNANAGTILPHSGETTGRYGLSDYEYFAWIHSRYNILYHSSLNTELILHNIASSGLSSEFSTGVLLDETLRSFTAFFHGGHNLVLGSGGLVAGGAAYSAIPHKFVDAGLPYVKFQIDGSVKHLGAPASTSDNTHGKIEYYMLFNTYNHIGFTEGNIPDAAYQDPVNPLYTLCSNSDPTQTDLSQIFNAFNFGGEGISDTTAAADSISDLDALLEKFQQQNIMVPTIIADFQNPVYNVDWADTEVYRPDKTQYNYQRRDVYPLPGQNNPGNLISKAPNYGWCAKSNIDGTDAQQQQFYKERKEYNKIFKFMGCEPIYFTIDNLFLQDYDIMDRMSSQNQSADVNQMMMGFHMHREDILQDWQQLYQAISLNDSYPVETRDKIYCMTQRVVDYVSWWDNSANPLDSQRNTNWDTITDAHNGYYPPQPLSDPNGTNHNGPTFDSSYSGFWEPSANQIKTALRRFGPPAPQGYQPRCGTNYQNYFGVDVDASDETGAQLGNTNFEFNGGLKIGSIENIETLLGFDLSTLVEEFNLNNFTDPNVAANEIFNREVNKLFYDVFHIIPRIETKAREYYLGLKTPSEVFIPVRNTEYAGEGFYPGMMASSYVDIVWEYDDFLLNWIHTPVYGTQDGDFMDTIFNYTEGMNPNLPPSIATVIRWNVSVTEEDIVDGLLVNPSSGLTDGSTTREPHGINESNQVAFPFVDNNPDTNPIDKFEKGRAYRLIFYGQEITEDVYASNNNIEDHQYNYPIFTGGDNEGFPYVEIGTSTTGGFGNDPIIGQPGLGGGNIPPILYIPQLSELAEQQTKITWYNSESNIYPSLGIPVAMESFSNTTDALGGTLSRTPYHFSLQKLMSLANSPTLSSSEYEQIEFVWKVCKGLELYDIEGSIIPSEQYQKIMSIFFQPDYYALTAPDAGGNTYLAPDYWLNQTGIALNPYGSSDSTSGWGENYGPFKSYIKHRLSILNFEHGGIDSWELLNFRDWLNTGCVNYFPNIPPVLDPPAFLEADGAQLPDFTSEEFTMQTINPADADVQGYVSVTYGGPEIQMNGVPGNTWWKVCDYLNQFSELTDGSIDFIIPAVAPNATSMPAQILYSAIPFVNETGETIEQGFYPSNPSEPINALNPFFTIHNFGTVNPGPHTIKIKFDSTIGSPLVTNAFGPNTITAGFTPGLSFYQMVSILINEGITGPVIDAPENDGVLTLEDGINYFELTGDIRPYQLIQFCINNNVIELLHYFLLNTIDSGPIVPGDTSGFLDSYLALTIPPPAIGVFDGKTNVIRQQAITQGIRDTIKDNTGYFSTTGGSSTEISNVTGETSLIGNEIFTQSINPTNIPYYHTINRYEPSLAKSQEIFDVSWGHIAGSGSLVKNNGKSPSEAVYRQAANELIGNESGSFFSVSQSMYHQVGYRDLQQVENIHLPYMSNTPDPDEYVYILRTKQKLQEGYPLHRQGQINLSGSLASGAGTELKLRPSRVHPTDDNYAGGIFPESGQNFYYLFDATSSPAGIDASVTSGVYGYWFPDVGTWVINKKVEEIITGAPAATALAAYGDGAIANNTLTPNGIAKNDKEYNNSLKLVNLLQNNNTEKSFQKIQKYNYEFGPTNHFLAIIKLKNQQFNFTTNPTRFKDLGEEGEYNNFPSSNGLKTMEYNEHLQLGPSTYITHISLYDRSGVEVAIAKLSTPIKKDFFAEVVIKILLSYG